MAESADFAPPPRLVGKVLDLDQAPQFPRVAPSVAHALNRIYRHKAPLPIQIGEESYQIRWKSVDAVSGLERLESSYRFKIGAYTGTLRLDPHALEVLLKERKPFALPADLRCMLIADRLHSLVERLEQTSRLRFEWLPAVEEPADVDPTPFMRAHFLLQSKEGKTLGGGSIHIDDEQAFETLTTTIAGPPVNLPVDPRFNRLRVALPFNVGTTHITIREMCEIRSGDIISVEEWRSQGAGIYVRAALGNSELLGIAEGSKILIKQWKDISMENRNSAGSGTPDASDNANLPLDRLDAMEVTLRFEVGDLTVALGELKGIKPGHVFELTQPLNRSMVKIITAGNVLGKGYLVAIGDRLGVRVSDFAPTQYE